MEETVSFIHCADLHLDSPFKGMSQLPAPVFEDVRESTFQALDRLVEAAIDKKVDFILMAGDVFDSDRQSLKAQVKLNQAFVKLKEYNIQVYVSFGNHDFTSNQRYRFQFPENVFVFQQEQVSSATFRKEGKALAEIYGFSYKQRAVTENKTKEYQLTGEALYHIGMLHGSLSTNTEHDVYAPFELGELTAKPFDYWALGHIHKRKILSESPPVVYPGNIQGRTRKEAGAKGCYYTKLTRSDSEMEFIPLHFVAFEDLMLNISGCQQPHQLETLLSEALAAVRQQEGRCVVTLELESDNPETEAWQQAGLIEETIQLANETNRGEGTWAYIRDFRLRTKPIWDLNELRETRHFTGELVHTFDSLSGLEEIWQPLRDHRQARKYLTPFSKSEEEEMKQEAQDWLLNELLKD